MNGNTKGGRNIRKDMKNQRKNIKGNYTSVYLEHVNRQEDSILKAVNFYHINL